jgi:hypothetical protein
VFKWRRDVSATLSKIRSVATKSPREIESALYQEGQVEITEAKRQTPVDTRPNAPHPGQLRASGRVSEPEWEGKKVIVTLSFGGAAEDYAVYVHEDPDAIHPVGKWKYLQDPLEESAPYLAERIARRIDLRRAL